VLLHSFAVLIDRPKSKLLNCGRMVDADAQSDGKSACMPANAPGVSVHAITQTNAARQSACVLLVRPGPLHSLGKPAQARVARSRIGAWPFAACI
jgi:hypothetical protein